jgi:hypothetical protein
MSHVLCELFGLLFPSAALYEVVMLTHHESAMPLFFTQALFAPVTRLAQCVVPLEAIAHITRLAVP